MQCRCCLLGPWLGCDCGLVNRDRRLILARLFLGLAGVGEAFKGGWAGLWAGALHTLCGPDHLAVSVWNVSLPKRPSAVHRLSEILNGRQCLIFRCRFNKM